MTTGATYLVCISLLLSVSFMALFGATTFPERGINTENCSNGIDDDGDGKIDHLDEDCQCGLGMEHLPNVGFNQRNECCDIGFLPECFEHWKPISASPDYISRECINDFDGWKDLFGEAPDSSYMQMGGTSNDWESIGTCLLQPLEKDEQYEVSLAVIPYRPIDPGTPYIGTIHIYGWESCDDFNTYRLSQANSMMHCYKGGDQAKKLHSIDFSTLQPNKRNISSSIFTATENVEAISIEIDCNSGGVRTTFFAVFTDISIRDHRGNSALTLQADRCSETISLSVPPVRDHTYLWYKDGVPLSTETTNQIRIARNGNYTGTYAVAQISSDGCAIIGSTAVSSSSSATRILNETICKGDSIWFDNKWIKDEGSYTEDVPLADGCDSTTILSLSYRGSVSEVMSNETICTGDSVWFVDKWIKDSGVHSHVLTSQKGCDSTLILNVSVSNSKRSSINNEICAGDSIFFANKWISTGGTYEEKHSLTSGCDSIVVMTLSLREKLQVDTMLTICSDQELLFRDTILSQAGRYVVEVQSANGCDTIYNLELSTVDVANSLDTIRLCHGDNITYGDTLLSSEGKYTFAHTSYYGCDSNHVVRVLMRDTLVGTILPSEITASGSESITIRPSVSIEDYKMVYWAGANGYSCVDCSEIVVNPEQTTDYVLTLESIEGCRQSFYTRVRVVRDSLFHIPTVFSPNGDRMNDRFEIFRSQKDDRILTLSVYDRWGNRVGDVRDIGNDWKGWDGTYDGELLTQGVYLYIFTDQASGKVIAKGDVTVMY